MRKRQAKDGERSMFSGLLVCADCGSNLHFHFNQGNPEIKYFNCSNYKGNRGTCGSTHYVRVDFLEPVSYTHLDVYKRQMMGIETMKNVSPKTVDRSTLVQRSSIRLNPAAPREDRLREFIKQIRNPYCYLDGKTVVKISFAETDTTMEDCLEHYLRGL